MLEIQAGFWPNISFLSCRPNKDHLEEGDLEGGGLAYEAKESQDPALEA